MFAYLYQVERESETSLFLTACQAIEAMGQPEKRSSDASRFMVAISLSVAWWG